MKRFASSLAVVLLVLLVGCAEDEPVAPTDPEPQRTPTGSSPRRADPPPSSFRPAELTLELEPYAAGFEAPLLVTHAGDGGDLVFVVEQVGRIEIVDDGEVAGTFLDVTDLTEPGGEQGLLGLAFHPDYERNRRFFINYTDTAGDTIVAAYRASRDGTRADEASARTILKVDQPYSNHNGGHLAFGPDGYLYIGMGDGGSAGDPQGNGQSLDTHLGKMLRIDVDAGGGYGIPNDNPFVDGGGLPEIWAYGLRNPWRFSFDEPAGTLWIGDVGQDELEEINRVSAGEPRLNYGWDLMEGSRCYSSGDCDPSGLVLPFTEYEHDHGCSITGGFVYRGAKFDNMRGGYFFSDYCSGNIWGVDATARGPVEPNLLLASERPISSFGVDEDGELYVTDISSGEVLRVVDAG
ncbi:MAG TPA: PQQ-dependent sugar dehydrogenase [Actinomycetota bacterium]|nr:PQQ-dependent sugar dehydrogenase [Actinomycetota bacterium]